jgi:hypothetical protein
MVRLRPGLEIVEVDGGKVLLDTRLGVYWHLNVPAVNLLEGLGSGRTFDDLIGEISRNTGADESRVRSDHLALVDELRRAKLIEGALATGDAA